MKRSAHFDRQASMQLRMLLSSASKSGSRWSKEFLEAGKKRLAGDTAREATSDEDGEDAS